ncbi:hypothetical protein B0H10DRAFT_1946670 [Mycena sp. CBHHK59/15]|nr:hypothetical protein B0H10DRAFT_1946670 [Mycena sp. CBHHK59/15]
MVLQEHDKDHRSCTEPVIFDSCPMPPKRSGVALSEEGVPEERRGWLQLKSAVKHLGSNDHQKSLGLLEDARRVAQQHHTERQDESAAKDLRSLQFVPGPNLRGPVASTSSAGGPSAAETEMWDDYALNGAVFDAGDDADDPHIRHERLREEPRIFGLWNPEATAKQLGMGDEDIAAGILGEDGEDDFLAEIMRAVGLEEPELDNINGQQNSARSDDARWFPYPLRMMFLLDTLDNLPRLRISGSLMRVFLWILKESGCKDVPSFDGLRHKCYWCLAMESTFRVFIQDWANPTIRKLIQFYPEIPEDGIIRKIWHAQKWRKNMDLDVLSPMYDAGISHHYVNEVLRLKNGKFIIPIRWVLFRGRVYCDTFSIVFNDKNEATVIDDETSLYRYSPQVVLTTIEAGYPVRMPNPKREIAGGDPMYSSFLDYFGDDVSGNRTKSWNKHWNTYFTHRNLPRKLLQQEFHIHFVSTSPNASISEQFREFKTAVESTHTDPIRVQDEHGKTTRVCLHVNAGPSDNPMQSEVTGHIGGKGNRFCRKCEVGGTQKEKATDEGYHALFEPGIPRTKEKIILELEKQVKIACTGVASHVKDAQTQTGVKDVYTEFWIDDLISRFKQMKQADPNRSEQHIQAELVQWVHDNQDNIYSAFLTTKGACLHPDSTYSSAYELPGFDPTKDTPVEILHTILLGIVKYIWHISHTPWTAEQKQRYSVRLQSTDTDGLSIHAIRANYIMQYAGSLIGRQLKTIAQTNVFHIHDIVSDHKFMAWKATGELAALLWFPEIRNLPEYRRDLRVAVANVLDIFAMIDPSKIIAKIKYHLLVHLDDDAVAFGPLVGVATEIYECFNAVFRYCSILSNHLALSHDIALQLGDQEGLKHRLTGGWWSCGDDTGWRQAGAGVRHFLVAHPVLQKLLGWSNGAVLKSGAVKLVHLPRGQKERPEHALASTSAARAVNFGLYVANLKWRKYTSVMSESLDECFIGSWGFLKSEIHGDAVKSGRISDILVDAAGAAIVIVEVFQVLSARDEIYGMPVLHDCCSAKCEASGERPRMQERVESGKTEKYIVHNPLDRFIINSYAFHNAHLLRATLPRDLLAPIPVFEDRRTKHDELAAELCSMKEIKLAKRKRKNTEAASEDEGRAGPSKPRKRRKKALPNSYGAQTGEQLGFIVRGFKPLSAGSTKEVEYGLELQLDNSTLCSIKLALREVQIDLAGNLSVLGSFGDDVPDDWGINIAILRIFFHQSRYFPAGGS